jgi:hypothetical protein
VRQDGPDWLCPLLGNSNVLPSPKGGRSWVENTSLADPIWQSSLLFYRSGMGGLWQEGIQRYNLQPAKKGSYSRGGLSALIHTPALSNLSGDISQLKSMVWNSKMELPPFLSKWIANEITWWMWCDGEIHSCTKSAKGSMRARTLFMQHVTTYDNKVDELNHMSKTPISTCVVMPWWRKIIFLEASRIE